MNKFLSNTTAAITLAATIASVLVSGAALADTSYPKNHILRPITLNDGDFVALGAIGHRSKVNGDDGGFIMPALSYGITDNLTLGTGGLTYRLLAEDGLELAVNGGGRGAFDSNEFGDTTGYGASLSGKKVINENFALTFGLGYVFWNEEILENRSEIDYSVGVMFNVAQDWTLSGNYTLRDLKDFDQSSADVFGLNLSYAISDTIDVGVFTSHSDFEERENNTVVHNSFETASGLFAAWRF